MSLGLIKPGASVALRHPHTGAPIKPLYVRNNGTVVWPVLGASPDDDPDDPKFTGEGDDSEDDEEDDDDDDEDTPLRKSKSKTKDKSSDDDDDEDDDEDDDAKFKASRQAKRYRLELRAEQRKNAEMAARLKALEDRDKPTDEVVARDLTQAREQVKSLTENNRVMAAQLAFFKTNQVTWVDPSDAFALAEREGLFDDVIDEDGNVDARELRRGLKDLAKRKPHLVKKDVEDPKARGRKSTDADDEDEEDDEEPGSRRSARTMNGKRKGNKAAGPSRDQLAKRFPVLNQI